MTAADFYGYRKKFAVLVPSTNTAVVKTKKCVTIANMHNKSANSAALFRIPGVDSCEQISCERHYRPSPAVS